MRLHLYGIRPNNLKQMNYSASSVKFPIWAARLQSRERGYERTFMPGQSFINAKLKKLIVVVTTLRVLESVLDESIL